MTGIPDFINSDKHYLVIELVTGKTILSNGRDVFRRPGGPGFVQFVVVDLEDIQNKFQKKAPSRDTFTLTEIAKMAAEKSPTVHAWVKAGIIIPSKRDRDGTRGRKMLFDREDAFVACLVASLKRKCGLQLKKLKEVSAVVKQTKSKSRKRTAKIRSQQKV